MGLDRVGWFGFGRRDEKMPKRGIEFGRMHER